MIEYNQNLFSTEEKCNAFDRIADEYFQKNFGNMTKQDIELLLFDILLKNLIGTSPLIDYNKYSNYKLSKLLGITEARVNNLKIKRELKYPDENFEWIKSFANLLNDKKRTTFKDGNLKMNIPDPNLYNAIRNFVEENGGFVEYHLNSKILDIKIEYLLDFALEMENNPDDVMKNAIKKIKKERNMDKVKNIYSIGREAISAGADVLSIISVFTPNNMIISALKNLLN